MREYVKDFFFSMFGVIFIWPPVIYLAQQYFSDDGYGLVFGWIWLSIGIIGNLSIQYSIWQGEQEEMAKWKREHSNLPDPSVRPTRPIKLPPSYTDIEDALENFEEVLHRKPQKTNKPEQPDMVACNEEYRRLGGKGSFKAHPLRKPIKVKTGFVQETVMRFADEDQVWGIELDDIAKGLDIPIEVLEAVPVNLRERFVIEKCYARDKAGFGIPRKIAKHFMEAVINDFGGLTQQEKQDQNNWEQKPLKELMDERQYSYLLYNKPIVCFRRRNYHLTDDELDKYMKELPLKLLKSKRINFVVDVNPYLCKRKREDLEKQCFEDCKVREINTSRQEDLMLTKEQEEQLQRYMKYQSIREVRYEHKDRFLRTLLPGQVQTMSGMDLYVMFRRLAAEEQERMNAWIGPGLAK